MGKTWELSERNLPKNWVQVNADIKPDWTGAADAPERFVHELQRRAITAALLVLQGKIDQATALTQFEIKHKPFSLANILLNSSPEFTKRAWNGESLYKMTNLRSYDTGSLYGNGGDALLQEFWNLIHPDLRKKLWKLQSAMYHPDNQETGDPQKSTRFGEIAMRMEKANLL